jgi:hypothetical protein
MRTSTYVTAFAAICMAKLIGCFFKTSAGSLFLVLKRAAPSQAAALNYFAVGVEPSGVLADETNEVFSAAQIQDCVVSHLFYSWYPLKLCAALCDFFVCFFSLLDP